MWACSIDIERNWNLASTTQVAHPAAQTQVWARAQAQPASHFFEDAFAVEPETPDETPGHTWLRTRTERIIELSGHWCSLRLVLRLRRRPQRSPHYCVRERKEHRRQTKCTGARVGESSERLVACTREVDEGESGRDYTAAAGLSMCPLHRDGSRCLG
jgi:hypothetical protein